MGIRCIYGIFTQSNYGIVNKFGFWLMPAPPVFQPFVIQYQDERYRGDRGD